ncbi:MAG: NUDIX hydrolase [Francisellaceae bacterium]|nr:NUDIX hydrolase [Francisellaceae bacterium]
MKKEFLINLLKKYDSGYLAEQFFKQQMLDLLSISDNCFERSCRVGHFTASSWLLNSAGTKALLMHHAKLDRWLQLGGHCDGDADVLKVAIKEAQEESGIISIKPVSEEIFDLDVHLIPTIKQEAPHYHFDIRFLLQQVNSEEPLVLNRESKSLEWFSPNKNTLPTNDISIIRMLEKWNKLMGCEKKS